MKALLFLILLLYLSLGGLFYFVKNNGAFEERRKKQFQSVILRDLETFLSIEDVCKSTFKNLDVKYLLGNINKFRIEKILSPKEMNPLNNSFEVLYQTNTDYLGVVIDYFELFFDEENLRENIKAQNNKKNIEVKGTLKIFFKTSFFEDKEPLIIPLTFLLRYNIKLDRFNEILTCARQIKIKDQKISKYQDSFSNESIFCKAEKNKLLETSLKMKSKKEVFSTTLCPFPVLLGCFDSKEKTFLAFNEKKEYFDIEIKGLHYQKDFEKLFTEISGKTLLKDVILNELQYDYSCSRTKVKVVDECRFHDNSGQENEDHLGQAVLIRTVILKRKNVNICRKKNKGNKNISLSCCEWGEDDLPFKFLIESRDI